MRIRQNLHLDVTRVVKVSLEVDVRAVERGLRRTPTGFERGRQLLCASCHAHPDATTAGGGLDQDRITNAGRLLERDLLIGERGGPGHYGHARLHHPPARLHLVAHGAHAGRSRPDKRQRVGRAHFGKGRILGEEPVAGMDGVGPVLYRDPDQLLAIQVRLPRRRSAERLALVGEGDMGRPCVWLGKDGHRRDAHLAAGPHDSQRDLAAIGDENL